jgi:twitching motility protein PilT
MAKIDAFFKLMNDQGASDLHLVSGSQPILRVHGDMERVKYKVMENDELKSILYEICPENKIKVFEETGDIDFGYEVPNLARYRCNFFQQKWGVGAVFREIPSEILTAEQLGLPPVLNKLAMLHKGMVLVTGPTGSSSLFIKARPVWSTIAKWACTHKVLNLLCAVPCVKIQISFW